MSGFSDAEIARIKEQVKNSVYIQEHAKRLDKLENIAGKLVVGVVGVLASVILLLVIELIRLSSVGL